MINTNLKKTDPEIFNLIKLEEQRQKEVLEMIPSENYTSRAVMEALGTVLTNKYSEGYPHKRYYQGNKVIDEIEDLAIDRAKKLFRVPYVNVQPLSGSPANEAVYLALLNPKDKIMGMALAFGGHLTHGAPLSISGKFYTSIQYTLGKDGLLDFAAIEKQALAEKPKIIVCGFTAYPRIIDFKKFTEIADKVGAYLMADISHITGLIIGKVHPSPFPYAHIVTTTTHKTLRGPRGAMIMVTDKGLHKDPDLPKKIDSAIIPGMQGGPHDNQTAAIAVALKEAGTAGFKKYARQIVRNAQSLANELIKFDFKLATQGTDNHLILIDLRNKGVNGAIAAYALEIAGIVLNKNGVPFDTQPPFYPSGIRLGTPAITTRGMKEKEMLKIAKWISLVVEEIKEFKLPENKDARKLFMKDVRQKIRQNQKLGKIAQEIKSMCRKFPVP